MTKPADATWSCPYCDHRVAYGTGCAGDSVATCTLGTKNIHWARRVKLDKRGDQPTGRSIGIAEIANEEEGM